MLFLRSGRILLPSNNTKIALEKSVINIWISALVEGGRHGIRATYLSRGCFLKKKPTSKGKNRGYNTAKIAALSSIRIFLEEGRILQNFKKLDFFPYRRDRGFITISCRTLINFFEQKCEIFSEESSFLRVFSKYGFRRLRYYSNNLFN